MPLRLTCKLCGANLHAEVAVSCDPAIGTTTWRFGCWSSSSEIADCMNKPGAVRRLWCPECQILYNPE